MLSITWQQVKHLHKSVHFRSSNGPGGAAIRANGLRDECVNDYSVGVGSSPSQVDYSPSLFLLSSCLSQSYTPFYSTDPCLTDVSQHAADLRGTVLPLNLQDEAVRHTAGRSLSTLWSEMFTASSTRRTAFPT